MAMASPIVHVPSAAKDMLPPMLLVVGSDDFPMLPADNDAFVTALRAAGARVDLVTAAGRNHMGTVAALIEPSNPVLDRILGFIRDNTAATATRAPRNR